MSSPTTDLQLPEGAAHDGVRKITLDQFKQELRGQGVSSHEHFALRCPICETVQSARSLIAAGAGDGFDQVEKYLGFSCVGRFTNAGPYKKSALAGNGCDWTLGGLFRLHHLEVVTPDGEHHPRFEVASPDEAKALEAAFDRAIDAAGGSNGQ